MRNANWLLAAGLVAATAGCVETTGYPNSSYSANRGYYTNGYYSPSYNGNPYYSRSAASAARHPYGDYDRDGVPNRYDRDANGDGIPDRIQR